MVRVRACLGFAFAVVVFLSGVEPVVGFGDNGHIAVAKVADHYLTPTAKQKVDDLLHGKKIYSRKVCMFADSYMRSQAGKHTRSWHYVDIPSDKPEYEESRDCANKDCVVAQIEEQKLILKGTKPGDKAMALKFLIHFLGDIHQPLHCCERNHDTGGNDVHVRFLDTQGVKNLHAIWDTDILEENMQDDDPEDYADSIQQQITPEQKSEWEQTTDPIKWANDGHKLANEFAYEGVPTTMTAPFHIHDPAEVEGKLLDGQDAIEYELGMEYFRRRKDLRGCRG